jgi:hypothetical protein
LSLIGFADLDRPIASDSGRVFHAFGGGTFRLEPFRCAVSDSADGTVDFALELVRGFSDRDSSAAVSFTLAPEFATAGALAKVRELDPRATLSPCVMTDWWFRIAPSPALRVPPELAGPLLLASNGLGSARLLAPLSLDTGLLLESMLSARATLAATAEARFDGVSPRVPVVVRFDAPALLREVLGLADTAGELPREALVAFFARDPAALPLTISGAMAAEDRARFAETMADRIITRFGRYVAAPSVDRGPRVRLAQPAGSATIGWALIQPVLAERHVVLPVDLLSAAQEQVARLGIASVVERRSLATLPSFGRSRVTTLCNLPAQRTGVDSLGVTLTFPPRMPDRPQARTVTATFEPPEDLVTSEVALSPGEPLRYRYATFAVISDDDGTRQLEAGEVEGSGTPLRLSAESFPVELAVVEVTPALAQLAVVSGACWYEAEGRVHRRTFTLDSGQSSVALAVPRERTAARIECIATARDGSGQVTAGPFESLRVLLDLASFASYGPRQAQVRCVFDDGASLRALSLLPDGLEETDANVTSLAFTPAEPVRTFHWFAASPFQGGLRHRPYDASGGAWTHAAGVEPVVVYSSRLRRTEAMRTAVARSGAAIRESLPRRPGGRLESVAVTLEAAVEAIATSPSAEPTDEVLYTRIADATRKLYVPRYVLDVQTVSGQQRYRIAMTQGAVSSTLQVSLVAAVPPALGDAAGGAAEYPHALTIQLEYLVAPPAGAVKKLEFTEVSRNGAIVTASLAFATLQERDDVYRALTEPERRARLVVRRFIDVALPQAGADVPPGGRPHVLLPLRPITMLASPLVFAAAVTLATPLATATMPASPPVMARKTKTVRTESAAVMALAPGALRTDVATLVRRPVDRYVKTLPVPTLAFTGKDEEGGTRLRFAITNWADFSDDYFAPSPDLPPGGSSKVASRTWVELVDAETKARLYGYAAIASAKQLAELWYPVPPGTRPPRQASLKLTDRRTDVVRESNAVSTVSASPPAPPLRAVRCTLEQPVSPEPFAFSPLLHGYVFQGLVPATGSSQLVRHRLSWHDTFFTYLQDMSRPSVVYCFPDRFKVARRRDAPFTPFMTVRASSRSDGSGQEVVLDYVVAPHTDGRRLADARGQLLADPRFGAQQVEFQPFASSDVRYFIDRPSGTGSVRQERPDASLVLQGALKDTLVLSLDDFQRLFDAMHRRTASLFVGRVEIDVPGATTEIVPFEARMDDLEGELFSYTAAVAQDGSVQVTVRNEIESPMDVHALDATLTIAGRVMRGLPMGNALPHDNLLPGQSFTLQVMPETPMTGTAAPEVALDLSGVSVKPDVEAIWDSIFDRSATECFRVVTVNASASLFDPVPGREPIVTIRVEFEGGATAVLNATTLSAQARLDYAVDDVVLRRPVSNAYRYTVTVVRASGPPEPDAQPREQTAASFHVSVVR